MQKNPNALQQQQQQQQQQQRLMAMYNIQQQQQQPQQMPQRLPQQPQYPLGVTAGGMFPIPQQTGQEPNAWVDRSIAMNNFVPNPQMAKMNRPLMRPPLSQPPGVGNVALTAAAVATNVSGIPGPNLSGNEFTPPPQLSSRPPAVPPVTAPSAAHIEKTLARTETQKKNLKLYQHRDQIYQETFNVQMKRQTALAQEKKREIEVAHAERRLRMHGGPAMVFGVGYRGYGNGTTGRQNRITYPHDRRRPRRTREFQFQYEDLKQQAQKEDTLVPIRLDLENDGYRLRDTFTWNLNETLITPDQFAEVLCEDLQLPTTYFVAQIAASIREQVQDYFMYAANQVLKDDHENDGIHEMGAAKETNTTDNELIVRAQDQNEASDRPLGSGNKKRPGGVELRTLIKLDITVGNRALLDQFEWDIGCPKNSPEAFAAKLADELGLGGEFKTAIAHSIREQIYTYTKSLLLLGYEFTESSVVDDDLRSSFLPELRSIVRETDTVEQFTPAILELTDAEIDKIEKDRMRDARRKRRQGRGRRGIILPDREPQKTHRTTVAVPPEQEVTDEAFAMGINMGINGVGANTRGSTPTTGYEPMHSQRKSALKARMNIAAEAAGNQTTSGQSGNYQTQHGLGMQGVISLNAGNRFSPMVDHTTRPIPSKMVDRTWMCANCHCSAQMTTMVRSGPLGDKTLCNACGLYYFKFNAARPPNYTDAEIRNDLPSSTPSEWQSVAQQASSTTMFNGTFVNK